MSTRNWAIYLLHFARPYKHASHYLGTSNDVPARVAEHLRGQGSPLVKAAVDAGIGVTLVRVWASGGRGRERMLKKGHHVPRLCPVCSGRGLTAKEQLLLGRTLDTLTKKGEVDGDGIAVPVRAAIAA